MRKKIMIIVNAVFLLVVVTLFYQAFKIYLMRGSIEEEIVVLEEKMTEYTEKKKKLEENIRNFSEEEKVERIARDRLNLKKEGEVVYKIVD